MCLSKVNYVDGVGVGYKLLDKWLIDDNHKLKPNFHWSYEWKKANTENKICADDLKIYTSGYHIFIDKEDAINYSTHGYLVEVHFKNIMSIGFNPRYKYRKIFGIPIYAGIIDGPCVVAEYMKVGKVLGIVKYGVLKNVPK